MIERLISFIHKTFTASILDRTVKNGSLRNTGSRARIHTQPHANNDVLRQNQVFADPFQVRSAGASDDQREGCKDEAALRTAGHGMGGP